MYIHLRLFLSAASVSSYVLLLLLFSIFQNRKRENIKAKRNGKISQKNDMANRIFLEIANPIIILAEQEKKKIIACRSNARADPKAKRKNNLMEMLLLPWDRECVERKTFLRSFVSVHELYGAQCATMAIESVAFLASSSIWQLMSLDFLSSLYSRKNPSIFRSLLWSMSHREHILTRFVIMDINFTPFFAHFLYSVYFFIAPPTHICACAQSVRMCAH